MKFYGIGQNCRLDRDKERGRQWGRGGGGGWRGEEAAREGRGGGVEAKKKTHKDKEKQVQGVQ